MIYILLGLAVFGVLVWAGRKARPTLEKREWRVAAGGMAAVLIMAGGFVGLRGNWPVGVALAVVGGLLAIGGRRGAGVLTRVDDPEFREALSILGVEAGATKDEIRAAYARLIRTVHPDAGGSAGLAARLNAARDRLLKK